ncbi:MAG: ATP synthase F1 subunit delta [Nitrospirota bacterium]
MTGKKHAKRYAKMFLNAAGLEGAEKGLRDLAILKALRETSPEFRNFVVSPMFAEEERNAALDALGRKLGLAEVTVKFVKYLSERDASDALEEVADRAVALYAEMKKLAKATVLTPVPIGSEYDARIKESLRKLTQREVEVEYVTDPSLLGGMLVKVGSTMYDGSVRGQLRLLKDELIKG